MFTFTWLPEEKATPETTFQTLTAAFGEGYEQAAGDGLNNIRQSWPLTFFGEWDKIDAIRKFLDARGGYEAFLWTPPGETEPIAVRVTSYTRPHRGANAWVLNATFIQKFIP